MSDEQPDSRPMTTSAPVRQPASAHLSVAGLVGAGFGLALLQTPTMWLVAVALLFAAVVVYAILQFGLRKRRAHVLSQSARTAHGVRVIVLFLVAFGITRITPPESLRTWYALAGAVIIATGGYVILRMEESVILREIEAAPKVSDGDDRIES